MTDTEDLTAPEVLSALTGEPAEYFTVDFDEYPLPDPEDLDRKPA